MPVIPSSTPLSSSRQKQKQQQQQMTSSSSFQKNWILVLFLFTAFNGAIQLIGKGNAAICDNNMSSANNNNNNNNGHTNMIAKRLETFVSTESARSSSSSSRIGGSHTNGKASSTTTTTTNQQQQQQEDTCQTEYARTTSNRTLGLTNENLKRSWTHVGSRKRLAKLGHKLQQRHQPISAVVSGGSISLGHGVIRDLRYSNRLETWMNEKYPLEGQQKHTVLNKGSHGADICAMAKRLTLLMQDLPNQVDLIVLEFAVNDYQGQDHRTMIDFKMDVFFDGFETIAMCTETVLHRLLHRYPDAAIVFLEMRTAIMARKTASLLHMGAAQQYQVPVISYDQALFPDYQFLLNLLKPFNYSTRIGDTVLPYPHGCHPCVRDHMSEGSMREKGCATVCRIQQFSPVDAPKDCKVEQIKAGREPCYIPFFAHDEVHPSGIGHQIASDLIIDAIATTTRDVCHDSEASFQYAAGIMPQTGWMVSDPTKLNQHYNFLMVNDTYEIFVQKRLLQASSHSVGFTYYEDKFGRFGWIATNPAGGESVQFDIDVPVRPGQCYVPYLSVLKSYENMGTFTVTVLDLNTQQQTSLEVDSLWKPRISVPSDIQLTDDSASPLACTGKCRITVTTKPQITGRAANKVKIVTLSVRACFKL